MLILLVMLPASRSLAQFNFTINSAAQVSYMNPFLRPLSSDFELNFTYFNPPPGTPKFLNAYIRVPFTTTQRWVIQNLLLDTFASPRPLTYTMKLGPLGYVDGMPTNLLDISYFITDTVQKDSINVPPTSYQPPDLRHRHLELRRRSEHRQHPHSTQPHTAERLP